MSDPTNAAPGWYPTPEGGQRYWDGQKWLSLPDPSSVEETPPTGNRVSKNLAITVAVALLAVTLAGGAWKLSHDSQVRSEQQAAQAARDAQAAAAEQEAQRAANVLAEQEKQDAASRLSRTLSVAGIESSVKEMAEGHVAKGLVDGPIISVSCSPVSGGSTDDLTETTTVFECFAANEDNGDGTMSGYKYNSTMNWTTGKYTYGLGAP